MVKSTIKKIQAAALALPLCLPVQAWAAATDLSNMPLATSSDSVVLPNILFTLDNSGSMGRDHLPDYVSDNNSTQCKPSTQCLNGMPPFQAGDYNGMAYNPSKTYSPPVNADGTSKTAQSAANTTNWATVKVDGYGVQSTNTINLTTGYPDTVYCDNNNVYGCKQNGIDTNNPFFVDAEGNGAATPVYSNPPAYAFPGTISVPGTTVSSTVNLFNGTLNGPTTTQQTVFNGTLNNGSPATIILNGLAFSLSGTEIKLTYTSTSPTAPAIATGDTITVVDGGGNNSCGNLYKAANITITKGTGTALTYASQGTGGKNSTNCAASVKHAPSVALAPSISLNNNKVTVTLAAAHGLATGDMVNVASGAATCDAGYRATGASVTVVNATTFTYTAQAVLGTASNTSCNITKAVVTPPTAPGIIISGNVVTVMLNSLTDSTAHALAVGDVVQVTGTNCGTAFRTSTAPGVVVTTVDNATKSFTYTSTTPAGTTGRVCKIDRAIMAAISVPVPFTRATTQNGAPYEYVIIPVEYCDSPYLTKCVASSVPKTVSGVDYSYPAPVRFCKNAATAALPPGNAGAQITPITDVINCQGKFSNATGLVFTSVRYGLFYRVDVLPSRDTYGNAVLNATVNANGTDITFSNVTVIDRSQRSDCAAAPNCTYAEEMTNIANHYAYYRTRMQMMKTSAGKAFKPMDNRYRIGFITIDPNWATEYLPVSMFDQTQKNLFYNKFYAVNPSSRTPLREALARAGRYFAGLHGLPGDSITDDPMEYSCQQNFTLLTTDGYWNAADTKNPDANVIDLNKAVIGNRDNADSGLSQRSFGVYDGGCAAGSYSNGGCANTLADVAQYYYATDLRTAALNNCTSGSATGAQLCTAPDPVPTKDSLMNNVPTPNTSYDLADWQHMVTFSLGLADGLMLYQPDYASSTTGDFSKIKSGAAGCSFSGAGTCNWPTPKNNEQSALDDLWHAAVNGRGAFYNARDPVTLERGLSDALNKMKVQVGAAAASATSSPNITRTDRSIFSSTYRTVKWDGEVVAQLLDPMTGNVPSTALTALSVLSGISLSGNTVTVNMPGHGLLYGDMVQVANAATGTCDPAFNTGGQSQVATVVDSNHFTYNGNPGGATTNTQCQIYRTGIVWSAQKQLDIKVRADTDPDISSRFIFTYDQSQAMPLSVNGPNGLKDFLYTTLTTTERGYFDNKCTFSTLSQCTAANLTSAQIASGNMGTELVPYLRGQQAMELTAPYPVYRTREHFLGDSVNSKPAYVRVPIYNFQDITPNTNPLSYATFQADKQSRQGMLYIASNDGMLHAFDAGSCISGVCTTGTGNEVWAYVPRMVMHNLYKLADVSFSSNHNYFVDGSPEVMDIYMDGTATPPLGPPTATPISTGLSPGWHTILVGGLNKGGRGFYALDITNPAAPIGLWEVCADTDQAGNQMCAIHDPDMGYSYGNPVITKRSLDDKWVVLVTSGYNNTSPGTGQGYLYVLDAVSGAILSKTPNGSGSTATPSGLAKINAWADDGNRNNIARFVYGGDMNGDVWRFDLGAVPSKLPSLTSISLSGATVTVNLTAHGLSTGGSIQVANAATGTCDSGFNTSGQSVTVTVVNANQFTYTSVNSGGATLNTGCQVLAFPFPAPPPVTHFATLLDASGVPQPITTRPELGDVNTTTGLIDSLHGSGEPAIFIGTGRYLGASDVSNTQTQSIYALRDDFSLSGVAAYVGNPRGRTDMVVQTIIGNKSSNNPVDWGTKEGWYADFPDTGERANLDPFLALGTLIVATNVPGTSACETGGISYLYQFDFRSGSNIATAAFGDVRSKITNALTVGVVVVRLPSGQLRAIATSASGGQVNLSGYVQGSSATRRTSWRELVR